MTTSTPLVEAHRKWTRANPLREWRTENSVTIHAASSMLGVSMTSIQLWESGSAHPSRENMEKLTKVTGMPHLSRRWEQWVSRNPAADL